MKSKEMNGAEAIEKIKGFSTLVELADFKSEDEDRKGVLAAIEERTDKIIAQEQVKGAPPVNPSAGTKEPEKPAVTCAPFDTCRYHEDFPPRMFKKGETIPEDWHDTQDSLKRKWTYLYDYATSTAKWVR